jgi:hypothetical protein
MIAAQRTVRFALACVCCVLCAGVDGAPRTFVASTGNDAHACNLVQPCRSFTRALTQTEAGGEIVVLDSAGYGPVTIAKSVSISAPPGIYGGISVGAGQRGVHINAPGVSVVLRGLHISGSAGSNHGVHFQAGAELRIERCLIENVGGLGIEAAAPGGRLAVAETIVRANGSGVLVSGVDVASFDRLTSERNVGDGLFLLRVVAPAPGLRALIVDSVFASNGANGVLMFQGIAQGFMAATIERTSFLDNGQGLASASNVRLHGTGGSGLVHAAISRSAIAGFRGIFVLSENSTKVTAIVTDTIVSDHRGIAIDVVGNGARVASSRNTLFGGSIGLAPRLGGMLFSTGDNVIFDHTNADTINTITPLPLH